MKALDGRARDALARYRASLGPSPEDAILQWEAIEERVVEDEAAAPHPEPARGRSIRVVVAVLVGAAAAALLLVVAPWTATHEDPSAAPIQSLDRVHASEQDAAIEHAEPPAHDPRARIEQRPAAPVQELDAPVEPRPETPSVEPRDRSSRAQRRPNEVTAPSDPLARLQAESRLVNEARRALRDGDHRRVLALANRHARSHSDGAMHEEIELLRVQALCDAGDRPGWERARKRFERRFPRSPLRVHLRKDCFE